MEHEREQFTILSIGTMPAVSLVFLLASMLLWFGFDIANAQVLMLDGSNEDPAYCNAPEVTKPPVPGEWRTNPSGSTSSFRYRHRGVRSFCGRGSHFVDTWLQRPYDVFVELPVDGQTRKYLPLRLARADRQSIRTKVQSACYQIQPDEISGRAVVREIWMSSFPPGIQPRTAWQDILQIRANGSVNYKDQKTDMFYLVQEPFTFIEEIKHLITNFQCRNGETYEKCRSELIFAVDRLLDFELRLHVAELSKPKKEKIDQHNSEFESKLGDLSDFQKLLHEKTKSTEVGRSSPYYLSDAIIGNSGPSFSVEQLDIGVNSDARALFSSVFVGKEIAGIPLVHRKMFIDKENHRTKMKCLYSPFRLMGFTERQFYNRYHKQMNEHLEHNKDAIAANYAKWLAALEQRYDQEFKDAAFRTNPSLAIVMLHVSHWMGPSDGGKLAKFVDTETEVSATELDIACAIRKWLIAEADGRVERAKRYDDRFFKTVDLEMSREALVGECAARD